MQATHEVFNQSTPFVGRDLFAVDTPLREGIEREGAAWARATLSQLGTRVGDAEVQAWARQANQQAPRLHAFDRSGRRTDEIEFHPAWHALVGLMVESGVHAEAWNVPGPGAQVLHAAQVMLFAQAEHGAQCPVTMSYAARPLLERIAAESPGIARSWLPRLRTRDYDPRPLPVADKRGVLIGMGLTEKQGGSDLRGSTTAAEPDGEDPWGRRFRLTGHKWFYSAPQCDAHLVLARTDSQPAAGLSCFLLPRLLPDGTRNAIAIQRLKDKLGNRSNASAEVEFDRALAWQVGEPGRGIATLLEVGALTRADCAFASAGTLRGALTHALHHARGRHAFGRPLVEQPLMRAVLADLALDSEAATALSLRLARALDARAHDPAEAALARVLIPVAKFWICKRLPAAVAEALEVLGGNGYVEEAPLARYYREAPLNSLWEGAGNVICLDVLRAFARAPAARDALAGELARARGADRRLDAYVEALLADLAVAGADADGAAAATARTLACRIAVALQGTLLQAAPGSQAAGAAWCAARLGATDAGGGLVYGTLPPAVDPRPLLDRALPAGA